MATKIYRCFVYSIITKQGGGAWYMSYNSSTEAQNDTSHSTRASGIGAAGRPFALQFSTGSQNPNETRRGRRCKSATRSISVRWNSRRRKAKHGTNLKMMIMICGFIVYCCLIGWWHDERKNWRRRWESRRRKLNTAHKWQWQLEVDVHQQTYQCLGFGVYDVVETTWDWRWLSIWHGYIARACIRLVQSRPRQSGLHSFGCPGERNYWLQSESRFGHLLLLR